MTQEKIETIKQAAGQEEMTLKDLILSIRNGIRFLWAKKWIIVLAGIIGAALGLFYAMQHKPTYTATTSFVLETGNSGGSRLSSYAGIASAFGVDLGGAGGGLFEGENILELYKSRNMITQVLLTKYAFDGKTQLLIDRYIDYNELRKGWSKKPALASIKFNENNVYPNDKQQLLHDSIMGQIVKGIGTGVLKVSRKDKKLNIYTISAVSNDEAFAKAFNEVLVQTVNQFYLDTKSRKNLENVAILQSKTDSVRGIMSGAINKAAAVADATPNQNVTRMAQRVAPMQNARVSAEVNQAVLGTLLQNLELSKISLLKETPLIQIVDEPILPLEKKGFGKLKGLIMGGFLGGFVIIIFLMIRNYIRSALQ